MNSKLVDLLREVDSLKVRLSSLRPLPVETLKKIQDALDIEYTYESNRIEGNTLTYKERHLFSTKESLSLVNPCVNTWRQFNMQKLLTI